MRDPARWRIVVVALEHIAKRRDDLFVAVAVVVANDLDVAAIGIHARREPADVDMAIIALLTRDTFGVHV